MQTKSKRIFLLCLDTVIVLSVLLSAFLVFFTGGEGNMVFSGFNGFRYFTIDSNILLGIAMAMGLGYRLRAAKDGSVKMPLWLRTFQHAAVVGTTLTFLTVVFFLGLIFGYKAMFSNENFMMHLSSPVLGIVSLLLSDKEPKLRLGCVLTGILPALTYGIFYCAFILTGVWEDFYCFNMNGMLPLTIVIIATVELLTGYLFYRVTGGERIIRRKTEAK